MTKKDPAEKAVRVGRADANEYYWIRMKGLGCRRLTPKFPAAAGVNPTQAGPQKGI